MEKLPIKKFNQVRKVASAAIHIAAMDPSHAALKPENHLKYLNKKNETEIVEVQQQNPAETRNMLDEQLKKGVEDYFKKENTDSKE